jgi:uncharacterized protein (DUF305 family)
MIALPAIAAAQSMPGMDMGHASSGAASPSNGAYMDSMQTMTKAMNVPMTGDADKDFAAMMIPHHQGAIDMAKVELRYGKDPTLRKLAQKIVGAQEHEIAQMKGWQAKHAK